MAALHDLQEARGLSAAQYCNVANVSGIKFITSVHCAGSPGGAGQRQPTATSGIRPHDAVRLPLSNLLGSIRRPRRERVTGHPGRGARGQGRSRSPAIACRGVVRRVRLCPARCPGETGTCGVSRRNPHPSRARRLCQLMQSRPDNSLATVTFALASALARSVLAAAVARNVLADLMRGRD